MNVYRCHRHRVAFIAVHYHNKGQCKISAGLVKDFSRKGSNNERIKYT